MNTTVLAYHAIGDRDRALDPHNLWIPARVFDAQMTLLAREKRVVPLRDLVEGRTSRRRAVAITFDDAYRSVLENAIPILTRLGLPATIFVPTAFIGDRNRWDGDAGDELAIMDSSELRSLPSSGITIESHGHRHIDLQRAPASEIHADLTQSIEAIADLTGAAPQLLAYPFRTGSADAQRIAAELGFRAAFSIDLAHGGTYAWGRVYVGPDDGDRMFRLKSSGRYLALRHNAALDAAYRTLRRVVPG